MNLRRESYAVRAQVSIIKALHQRYASPIRTCPTVSKYGLGFLLNLGYSQQVVLSRCVGDAGVAASDLQHWWRRVCLLAGQSTITLRS